MGKTITFSFESHAFPGVKARETFTFEELGLDEEMVAVNLESEINRIYGAWIWKTLDTSGSVVVE